jgi:hypothetical protein
VVTRKKSQHNGWLISLLFLMAFLASCSPVSSSSTQATPLPSQQITYSCHLQQTPFQHSLSGPEIHGSTYQGSLWALIQSNVGLPIPVNSLIKFIWRITGSGAFSIVALGPQGKQLQSGEGGPSIHGGSTWDRPGSEWGTVFTFPIPGCWDLHASRNGASGDVWLNVIAKTKTINH